MIEYYVYTFSLLYLVSLTTMTNLFYDLFFSNIVLLFWLLFDFDKLICKAFLPAHISQQIAPDGTSVTSDNKSDVIQRWGNTWNRYYQLDTQYFMADLTKRMVDILAKNFTWISVLSVSLKNDAEYRQQLAVRMDKIATAIDDAGPSTKGSSGRGGARSVGGGGGAAGGGGAKSQGNSDGLKKAKLSAKEVGTEQVMGGYTQTVKTAVFSAP